MEFSGQNELMTQLETKLKNLNCKINMISSWNRLMVIMIPNISFEIVKLNINGYDS